MFCWAPSRVFVVSSDPKDVTLPGGGGTTGSVGGGGVTGGPGVGVIGGGGSGSIGGGGVISGGGSSGLVGGGLVGGDNTIYTPPPRPDGLGSSSSSSFPSSQSTGGVGFTPGPTNENVNCDPTGVCYDGESRLKSLFVPALLLIQELASALTLHLFFSLHTHFSRIKNTLLCCGYKERLYIKL